MCRLDSVQLLTGSKEDFFPQSRVAAADPEPRRLLLIRLFAHYLSRDTNHYKSRDATSVRPVSSPNEGERTLRTGDGTTTAAFDMAHAHALFLLLYTAVHAPRITWTCVSLLLHKQMVCRDGGQTAAGSVGCLPSMACAPPHFTTAAAARMTVITTNHLRHDLTCVIAQISACNPRRAARLMLPSAVLRVRRGIPAAKRLHLPAAMCFILALFPLGVRAIGRRPVPPRRSARGSSRVRCRPC